MRRLDRAVLAKPVPALDGFAAGCITQAISQLRSFPYVNLAAARH
jgi:hypothetical protein